MKDEELILDSPDAETQGQIVVYKVFPQADSVNSLQSVFLWFLVLRVLLAMAGRGDV